MLGSTFTPQRWIDVEASKVLPEIIGVQSTISFGTVQTIDTVVADDVFIRGLDFLAKNSVFGDSITIKIVDVDGVYFPVNTIISTPVTDYVIGTNQEMASSYTSVAPLKMLGGLAIRIIYTSTGSSTNVNFGINFLFLKALV